MRVDLVGGEVGWGCYGPALHMFGFLHQVGALRGADVWPFRPRTLRVKGQRCVYGVYISVLCVLEVCECCVWHVCVWCVWCV